MARKTYTMTQEQLQKILDASRPVMHIVANGIPPRSPQENANDAWAALGEELGFDYMTVRPCGPDAHVFTAEEKA